MFFSSSTIRIEAMRISLAPGKLQREAGALSQGALEVDAAAVRLDHVADDREPQPGAGVGRLALDGERHGARAREIEEALRDVAESLDVLVRDLDERAELRVEPGRALLEHLDRHPHRGEGRAELVRERGDQVLAAPFLVAEVGDVLERQNEARE